MTHVVRLFALGAIAALLPTIGYAAAVAEPPARPALVSRIATQSVLQSVTRAGERLVTVGERGIILLSDDSGKHWRQASVPVSVTLTAVSFPTEKQGWAVGHYGVVLHSADGGESWERQLDGIAAARLVLDAVQASSKQARPDDAAAQKRLAEAQRLEQDGADKPFLDLHFADANNGFVVGAYNLMFRTEDGGKTWQYWGDRLDNAKANHIYAIKAAGNDLYLAGEQGLVLHSADRGKRFTRLETPYMGSYFTLAVLPAGDIVLAGLRGNAYRSGDRGASWQKIEVPVPVSFLSSAVSGDGALLLANQAGQIFVSRDQGRSLQALPTPPLPPINGMEILPDGSLLTVGMRGPTSIPMRPGSAAKDGGNP